MKRMTHPDHGAHHAMNANEEQQMLANGWKPDEAPAVKQEDEAPPVVKRLGRPPAKAKE